MKTVTTISPSVLIDGKTVTPPGWMWVFAFAIRGCEWAEKECAKPEFDAVVKGWLRDQKIAALDEEAGQLEARVADIRSQIKHWREKEIGK